MLPVKESYEAIERKVFGVLDAETPLTPEVKEKLLIMGEILSGVENKRIDSDTRYDDMDMGYRQTHNH